MSELELLNRAFRIGGVCIHETPPYRANILTRSINSDEKSVQLTLTMTYDYEEIIVKCQVSYIIFKKRKIIIN